MPPDKRADMRSEMRKWCLSISKSAEHRAQAFADLLSVSTDNVDRQIVAEALEAAEEIKEPEPRARAFQALLNERRLSRADRLHAFERMLESAQGSKVAAIYGGLRRYKSVDRGFLLHSLAESSEAIATLGGEGAIEECFDAIRDAAAWWP